MRFVFKGKILITMAAVFVLLIFLHSLNVLSPLERGIFKIFSPVQKALFGAGASFNRFVENITFKKDLNEMDLLKAQMRRLLIENAELKILAEENNLLKKELGFNRSHSYELVAARALGYNSAGDSNLILLQIENDRYHAEDLAINMPVVAEDGILVGKIAHIKDNQIYMRSIISSQSAVAAAILNKDYTTGVAEGELNYSIKMRMIPQSEKLKQGDLIVTSGLEEMMPKGLLIGTVSKVEHDPQNPFDIAYLTPLYNQKNISKLLIIKSY
ncbi:MAG: rod shape-determining protein MreC [Patescibacteria group bacterium]